MSSSDWTQFESIEGPLLHQSSWQRKKYVVYNVFFIFMLDSAKNSDFIFALSKDITHYEED